MAVIYYPKNQLVYIRDTTTSGSNYESVYLNTQPNTIIYFDTSSMMQGINASLIPITASWAMTASVSQVFVTAITASWATQSLSASYSNTASYAGTSSYAINAAGSGVVTASAYTTITTSSLNWITCSFSDTTEFISITTSALYNFTCSNAPLAGLLSEVSLFISNSAQFTSSLTFPSNWIFLGSKPNAITASRCAILSLQSYGPSVQVAGWSVQY